MFALGPTDVLWTLGTIAFLGALAWLALKIDPHWTAKDGRAFTCKIQPIRASGRIEGRWRQARATVSGDTVKLIVRGIGVPVTPYEAHHVMKESDDPPKGKAVFVLDGEPLYALRIPKSSAAAPVLRSIIRRD